MRTIILVIAVAFASVCLADPSPSPIPTQGIPSSLFSTVWAWIMGHQIILGGFLAGAFDFIFALNPKWKSNGVIHWLYLFARKKAGLPDLPVA